MCFGPIKYEWPRGLAHSHQCSRHSHRGEHRPGANEALQRQPAPLLQNQSWGAFCTRFRHGESKKRCMWASQKSAGRKAQSRHTHASDKCRRGVKWCETREENKSECGKNSQGASATALKNEQTHRKSKGSPRVTTHGMLCAQAWKPSSQDAGEERGVAGLLLGRTERAARAAELQLCAQAP